MDGCTARQGASRAHSEPVRVVVTVSAGAGRAQHDHASCAALAQRVAAIKRCAFAGEYDADSDYDGRLYFVPMETVIGLDRARVLRIVDEDDVFGGVVAHPFIACKSISHPLVDRHAAAPAGWSWEFAARVQDAVLRGYAAFDAADAQRAAQRLLAEGRVRLKRALGVGGRGQYLATEAEGVKRALADIDRDEIKTYGLAIEQDLEAVTTFSVGQVCVHGTIASYCGTQRLTRDNSGELVYGGSDLVVARGDFEVLLALAWHDDARRAIHVASIYDAAAFACFPGLLASRRNYDVATGVSARGEACCGVLEQSWRAGGASAAELHAIAAFSEQPGLRTLRASTVEMYGENAVAPPDASIHFQGVDRDVGPLVKFTVAEPYGDA